MHGPLLGSRAFVIVHFERVHESLLTNGPPSQRVASSSFGQIVISVALCRSSGHQSLVKYRRHFRETDAWLPALPRPRVGRQPEEEQNSIAGNVNCPSNELESVWPISLFTKRKKKKKKVLQRCIRKRRVTCNQDVQNAGISRDAGKVSMRIDLAEGIGGWQPIIIKQPP